MNNTSFKSLTTMPKFITAEFAAVNTGIPAERLLELCAAGFAPHYSVDGGPPMFRQAEINAWTKANLVEAKGGMPMPREANVHPKPASACLTAPVCLRGLEGLLTCVLPDRISGVYFLCRGAEVVYVGQSTDVLGRVAQHRTYKDHDRAYYWPVPPGELDRVEGAFIRLLKPCLNGNVGPVTDAETKERVAKLVEVAA